MSAVARGRLAGVQFHPERSGRDGLRLLANFVAASAAAPAASSAARGSAGRAEPRRRSRGRLMLAVRVIPCLDVADGRVVKGTRFVDLVDEGDPPELAERYAARGRRRDRVPRHHGRARGPRRRSSTSSSARRGAPSCRSPWGAASGRVREMRDVLRAGADKVSLNTAAVATPDLVRRCARRFGIQAVVVAIDARRRAGSPDEPCPPGRWS